VPVQVMGKPGPDSQVSMQPCFAAIAGGTGALFVARPGSGLWPHSPAMALAPLNTWRRTTTPPPQPVPMITRIPPRRPPPRVHGFGKREAVGIVGQADLAPQQGFQIVAQGWPIRQVSWRS